MSEPQQPRQLTDLPESEQIKIIEGAAQDSNRMQRELVERAEPQQYTLRRPVTILNELRWSLELNMGDYAMPIDRDAFESEFVPVGSVDNLQQQIREVVESVQQHPSAEAKKKYAEATGLSNNASFRELQARQLDDAVERIVSLIQGQQK